MFYMITGPSCKWCDKAKELLQQKGVGFTAYSYNDHEIIIPLMKEAGFKTVPQIWVQGGEYVGGYEALVRYFEDQEVKE